MLPTGGHGVVVGDVHHVPAQHHITEAKTTARIRLGSTQKFVDVQILATQHAVDVTDSDLDLFRARGTDLGYGRMFGCFVLLGGRHRGSSLRG